MRELPVVIWTGEDGFFVVSCPSIPGCTTQGETRAEALANIVEAIELALECREQEGWNLPGDAEGTTVAVSAA